LDEVLGKRVEEIFGVEILAAVDRGVLEPKTHLANSESEGFYIGSAFGEPPLKFHASVFCDES